jgi:hypothetical protein
LLIAKITNNAVTAGKLATTLDLSSNTITLPSSFVTTTGTQTLTNKTIDAINASHYLVDGSVSNAKLANSRYYNYSSDVLLKMLLILGETLTIVSGGEGIDTVSAIGQIL